MKLEGDKPLDHTNSDSSPMISNSQPSITQSELNVKTRAQVQGILSKLGTNLANGVSSSPLSSTHDITQVTRPPVNVKEIHKGAKCDEVFLGAIKNNQVKLFGLKQERVGNFLKLHVHEVKDKSQLSEFDGFVHVDPTKSKDCHHDIHIKHEHADLIEAFKGNITFHGVGDISEDIKKFIANIESVSFKLLDGAEFEKLQNAVQKNLEAKNSKENESDKVESVGVKSTVEYIAPHQPIQYVVQVCAQIGLSTLRARQARYLDNRVDINVEQERSAERNEKKKRAFLEEIDYVKTRNQEGHEEAAKNQIKAIDKNTGILKDDRTPNGSKKRRYI